MQLAAGSTPAAGVAIRRHRAVAWPRAESLNAEPIRGARKVTGQGASPAVSLAGHSP